MYKNPSSTTFNFKNKETKKQILATLTVIIPLIFSIIAFARLLTNGISYFVGISFLITYFLTAMGLELGYHRYFSHKSFKTSKLVEVILAILGSSGAQGPVFYWASYHRMHHGATDKAGDPHSPKATFDEGGKHTGFFHAHVGWLFTTPLKNLGRNIRDLKTYSHLRMVNRMYLWWVLLGLVLPAILLSIFSKTHTINEFIDLILWTGFVRVFLAQHTVWMINSVCHTFGKQDFKSNDNSRNQLFLAILMCGAGWHNNHHAFPYSYHLQFKWHHIDIGGWILKGLSKIGIVWALQNPTKEQIRAKQL